MSENNDVNDPERSWYMVSQEQLEDKKPNETENDQASEMPYVENRTYNTKNASKEVNVNTDENRCKNEELHVIENAVVLGDTNSECSMEFDVLVGFQDKDPEIDVDGQVPVEDFPLASSELDRRHSQALDIQQQMDYLIQVVSKELLEEKDKIRESVKASFDYSSSSLTPPPAHELPPINCNDKINKATEISPVHVVSKNGVAVNQQINCWMKLVMIFTIALSISLVFFLLCFLYSGFPSCRQSDLSVLHEIQNLVTKCFGEQYQMSLKSGNNSLLKSRVCVYKKQEYATHAKKLLNEGITEMLSVGINNLEDPSFRSFAANYEAIDLDIIIRQLQFYKLLSVKEVTEDGTAMFKEAEDGNETIANSELGDDTMKELFTIMNYLTKSNKLLKEQIKYFETDFKENLIETVKNFDRDRDFQDHIHNLLTKLNGEEFKLHLNVIDNICSYKALYHDDHVKSLEETKNKHEAKSFTDTIILKILAQVLDMHHVIVNNFCEFNSTFKRMENTLEHLIEVLNSTSEVNHGSTWKTVSNSITSYLKAHRNAIHDFFHAENNDMFIQRFLESLEETTESMHVPHFISYLTHHVLNISNETLIRITRFLVIYIFILTMAFVMKHHFFHNRHNRRFRNN